MGSARSESIEPDRVDGTAGLDEKVDGPVGETVTADLALDMGRALVTDGADTVATHTRARIRYDAPSRPGSQSPVAT